MSSINRKLNDRIAIVLGAGSIGPGWGNGKAISVSYAREGAIVICADKNKEAADETARIIQDENNNAESYCVDVSSSDDMKQLVDYCKNKYGRIDIIHYNVGLCVPGNCVSLSEEKWHQVFDVNVSGAFYICKYAMPIMEDQGKGVFLTTGSIAGIRWTGVDYISYYTTKSALIQFTRAIAMTYAKSGIRAASILPGLMNTPIMYHSGLEKEYSDGDIEKMVDMRHAQCPTGQMGDAWDVANASVYLASDDARYVTATEIVVDGGMTAKYT